MQPMKSGNRTVVFFDLETTGLGTECDIIQVAAICGDRSFDVYTVPGLPITAQAADITGFSVREGALYLRDDAVATVGLDEALTSFMTFLRSFPQPVLLAAHNGQRFDAPILRRTLRLADLEEEFSQLNCCFLDTLLLAKLMHPGQASFSQVNLVQHFLGKCYNAHNALDDVRVLQELYSHWGPNGRQVDHCMFT